MNILIIDDEPLIAKTVLAQLSESNVGNDRYDLAFSTAEARNLMRERYYELFLCDIVMPQENGIQFAKWLLEEWPDSKLIFLTSHADFDYIKQAISMRSFDYILQPVDKNELVNSVSRAKTQIILEKKRKELIDTGAFFQDKEFDILNDNAIRYLHGLSEKEDYLRRMMMLNKCKIVENDLWFPFGIHLMQSKAGRQQRDSAILLKDFHNLLTEIMQDITSFVLILHDWEYFDGLIVLLRMEEHWPRESSVLLKKLEEVIYMAKRVEDTDTAIYYGDICDFYSLRHAYDAILTRQSDNVQEAHRVFYVGKSDDSVDSMSLEYQAAFWQLLLKQNRLGTFYQSVINYLENLITSEKINKEFLERLHQFVSESILLYMSSNDIKSFEVFDDQFSYYDFMLANHSVTEFKTAMKFVMEKLSNHIETVDETKVSKITRYIKDHLDEDISVASIAERAGLNQDYLSRMFKKSTGQSLKQFIVAEKMEAAKTLLQTTKLSVTEISARVGYKSYANFTKSFHKIYGCTPSFYRKD